MYKERAMCVHVSVRGDGRERVTIRDKKGPKIVTYLW